MLKRTNNSVTLIGLTMLTIGLVGGFFARPLLWPASETINPDEPPAADVHGNQKIVELSQTTVDNMDLLTGKFEVRDYYEKIVLPAEFVELIPDGRHQITAPLGGRIEKVHVAPGQAVSPGEPMFELSVTDEQVSEAQVQLLTVMSDYDSNKSLLDRTRRLADKQIVAGKKVLELELKLKELESRKQAIGQELLLRGLTSQQLEDLIENQTLVRAITITAPDSSAPSSADSDRNTFTVEELHSLKGKNLARGELLCELIHHGELLIKGLAFERDIEKIIAAQSNQWTFTAQIGEGNELETREGLTLHSIDNHVDPDSQTYAVYVSIPNEIVGKNTDRWQRPYLQWRFKSGQRAHLECPVQLWNNQVVAPIDAVVQDGPEAFVFKKFDHTHETEDGDVIVEFEKIPVKVLHTDRQHAVLEKQVTLDTYEQYALNQAFQLNLALKQAAAGGGGHSHSHHGHSH